ILESTGQARLPSEIPDVAAGLVWPGAMSGSGGNGFMGGGGGGDWALGQHKGERRQHCKRRARMATSRKPSCRWGKMPGSFTISRLLARSSAALRKTPNAY